ncbi:MAG TPA: glycoside hydrolase family 2 TIM barrel-domain containing protein [Paludibaculum sp.]|jgi:beta-mannosidase
MNRPSFYPNLLVLLLVGAALQAAQTWTVRLEEPTGIERRDAEIVRVPLAKVGGQRAGYRVTNPAGQELPWQVLGQELLFPATLIGGQMAEYRVSCCEAVPGRFPEQVSARMLASGRIAVTNAHLRVVLDAATGHIMEAYPLQAGPQRALNLVETTPEQRDKNDIHATGPKVTGPPSPLAVPNDGWSALSGPVKLDEKYIEAGPLAVRISAGEWSMELTAGSTALLWRAAKGFRFASVSALPHVPYDRFVDCDEYQWPTGPSSTEPPDHDIAPRAWKRAPGGCFVYYTKEENYGAFGVVALDDALEWTGAGTSRFEGRSARQLSSVALIFPAWQRNNTVLSARAAGRRVRQPVLVRVEPPVEKAAQLAQPAARVNPPQVAAITTRLAAFRRTTLPLDGEWELAFGPKGKGPGSEWRKVQVPGSVHLQWLPAAQIYSREAAWVSNQEWWYKRTFELPAGFVNQRVRLEFDATDYYAEAYLDGKWLGRHEGYIDPYSYDVTAMVKPGARHELQVRVWTPVHYYWKHRPYTVKGSYGGVDQKPDDITAVGITRGARLSAGAPERIADAAVATRLRPAGAAEVAVHLTAEGLGEDSEYVWQLTLSPRGFPGESVQVTAAAQAAPARLVIPVKNARLWWTWDLGAPNLYTLETRLLDGSGRVLDARTESIGIREIQRRADQFYLNGKRIFLRGTNTYANLWLSEMTREKYARDLDLIGKMNVNLLRVHCHFENPEFYDLADERGLLIWQDYLEAWYPEDTDFSRHAAGLFDNHIRMVRNHASIAVWSPSDEESLENYRDLTKHLYARPKLLDPQDRWVQRSTGRWGDSHIYHGWYDGSIWDYTHMDENLVTELGATSLPAKESLDKFLPGKWPIPAFADDWTYHRLQVPEARTAWGDLDKQSPEQLIAKSQNYAARLFQISLERTRRRKAEGAGGIFHFFAIDFWPSVTMAAIDFYRVPTKVAEVVRRSFEPVAALFEYDRAEWRSGETVKVGLWAVNDTYTAYPAAQLNWRVENAGGQVQGKGSFARAIAVDSSVQAGTAEWRAGGAGEYRMVVEVVSGGKRISENIYEFRVL